jgi:hypothetical protein
MIDLTADLTAKDFANYLQSSPDVGPVTVTKTGDCANLKWSVAWNSGGDKPSFTVN